MTKPLTNVGSHTGAYGPIEWMLTLTIGLIWGSAFLWIAMGVDDLSPGVVAFGRVALGAAALAAFPASRRWIAREDWPRVLAVALIGNAAPALLFAVAETELDSAVAGMITSGTPILSLLIASILMRALPPRSQAVGIGIGFAGILLMSAPSLRGADAAPLGVLLVLLATIGYGLSGNLLVPLQQRYGGPAVTLWALVLSSVALFPFAATTVAESDFTTSAVLAVIILGVVGTGVARSLAATLAGRAGAPRMSTTTYLIPIVAIILGVVVRDETVAPIALLGVVVALTGAVIASRAVRSASADNRRHVVITGPMGAGKTTLGEALAERLQRSFVDSDIHIESAQGRSGKDIAAAAGVPALHALESEFLVDSLAARDGTVIAAAASIADDPQRLASLTADGHLVVFIEVSPDRLDELARSGDHRRSLPATEAADLYRRRRAAAIAADALIISATDDFAGSVDRIVTALDGRS